MSNVSSGPQEAVGVVLGVLSAEAHASHQVFPQ